MTDANAPGAAALVPACPRIAVLARHQGPEHDFAPRLDPVLRQVIEHLRARGATVDVIVPEQHVLDLTTLRPQHDLYVLKSKTALAFTVAGAAAAHGAPVLNSTAATELVKDKVLTTAKLAGAGLPVPPSWAVADPNQLRTLLKDGPLWVKPRHGSMGRGVRRIEAAADLEDYDIPPFEAVLAQREAPFEGHDLKVYIVGEQVWAIRRPYPARTDAEKRGEPAEVSERVREIALACGRATGLVLYGVDILPDTEDERPHSVIDVNAFPTYRGIPAAPTAIAGTMWQTAIGR